MSRPITAAAGGGLAPGFAMPPRLLDAAGLPVAGSGVVLGCGTHGEPLAVSLLRAAPTLLLAVGALYLATLVALRTLASGARLVIRTGRPAAWHAVARAAAGPGPDGRGNTAVHIRPLTPAGLPAATEDAPLLEVHDGRDPPRQPLPPCTPWQTSLYLLPDLHRGAAAIANAADLVLLQRLPAAQARLAAALWRLPAPMARLLATTADDGVVVLGHNLWRPMRLVTTDRERQIVGPVRRGD